MLPRWHSPQAAGRNRARTAPQFCPTLLLREGWTDLARRESEKRKTEQMKYAFETYQGTRQQIQSGDATDFLDQFHPATLETQDLTRMCGALRLRIKGANEARDLYADPQTRSFIQMLHMDFPYWGFFLRLRPVRCLDSSPELVDVGVLFAIALCHTDVLEANWDHHNCEFVGFNGQQFNQFMESLNHHVGELGGRAGLSARAIKDRRRVVTLSVQSYLRLRGLPQVGSWR